LPIIFVAPSAALKYRLSRTSVDGFASRCITILLLSRAYHFIFLEKIMALNVEHLLRTAATLEQALLAINKTTAADEVMYDPYRNAAIKSFELNYLRQSRRFIAGAPRRRW
jgi:hypothetical protein